MSTKSELKLQITEALQGVIAAIVRAAIAFEDVNITQNGHGVNPNRVMGQFPAMFKTNFQ